MLKKWFSNLLTPKKGEAEGWKEFMSVMYDFYMSDVHPNIKRIKNRVSLSTMNDEDIDIKISELGKFFVIRKGTRAARAMLLRQRLDEIHFKGTDRPIEATFWRELKSMPAQWEPLYAPVDQVKYPYGSVFLQEFGLDGAKPIYGDFFLTSRGSISISLNDLRKGYGDGNDDLEIALKKLIEDVDLIIKPLLPAHIVFDGFRFVIRYTFVEKTCVLKLSRVESENRGAYVLHDSADRLKIEASFQSNKFIIRDGFRSLDEIYIGIDDVVMDGWEVGLRATPAILPNGSVLDDRVFTRNGYIGIKNDGYTACIITFDNGFTGHYAFPSFATEVILPVRQTRLALIQKIIYLDTLRDKITVKFDITEQDAYLKLIKTYTGINTEGFHLYDRSDKLRATLDGSIAGLLTGQSDPFIFPLTIDDLPMDSWSLGTDFTDED